MTFDLKTRPRRRSLPWSLPCPNLIEVVGVGRFFLQSVGNSYGTTGIDVYFHAEHEKASRLGYVRYSVQITPRGSLQWNEIERGPSHGLCRFPRRIDPIIQTLVNQTARRSPSDFMWSVACAAQDELRKYNRQITEMRRTIEVLDDCLAGSWSDNPFYLYSERSSDWMVRRENTIVKLRLYLEDNQERIALLERIDRAFLRWAHRCPDAYGVDVEILIATVVGERLVRDRPPFSWSNAQFV